MINTFKAILGKYGVSKPTLYKVEITKAPDLLLNRSGVSELMKDLSFFAESAEMSGTQILTQELRVYNMPQKFAYQKAHDELNVTFRLDGELNIRRFFDEWVNCIYDPTTGDIHYKADYEGTMQIVQMREDGSVAYGVEYQNVFPITVGQLSYGFDAQGTFNKQQVTFSFRTQKPMVESDLNRFRGQSIQPDTSSRNLRQVNTNSSTVLVNNNQ